MKYSKMKNPLSFGCCGTPPDYGLNVFFVSFKYHVKTTMQTYEIKKQNIFFLNIIYSYLFLKKSNLSFAFVYNRCFQVLFVLTKFTAPLLTLYLIAISLLVEIPIVFLISITESLFNLAHHDFSI